jgi:methylenetetrahydrofolate reductase (NADPH)
VEAIETLVPLAPRFVSVTYGAGGSTRERTHGTVARIARETALPAAAHLTCVEASRRTTLPRSPRIIGRQACGTSSPCAAIRPSRQALFEPHPGGYANAAELVEGLRALHPFEISVSAYPECHPGFASREADLDNLKRKIDAGATRAITQFFFEPDTFFRFRDGRRCRDRGRNRARHHAGDPASPPISACRRCAARFPEWMAAPCSKGSTTSPTRASSSRPRSPPRLCRKLYVGGVRQFHFYTLNRAELTYAICHLLGKRAPQGVRP